MVFYTACGGAFDLRLASDFCAINRGGSVYIYAVLKDTIF